MSERVKLLIAVISLGAASLALAIVLFATVIRSQEGEVAVVADAPQTWRPGEMGAITIDRWADREDWALRRTWRRPGVSSAEEPDAERTVRQVVESDLLRETFTNLRWDRIERVGWRAFQLDDSVYEVQFVLRDVGVELGPAWVVQLDPDGPQPPDSDGVVPANVFAEVVERGVDEDLERYLNREPEVVQALTNHQFEGGARLASALLVYFKSHRGGEVADARLDGWTVVPERIVPDELNLYRASFQWHEGDQSMAARWEVNLDTHQFRGLNLLATDIMAVGDGIDTSEIENLRPVSIDEREPSRRERNSFTALRAVVDDDRLIEAVGSLLWHQSRHGATIDYRLRELPNGEHGLNWYAGPVSGESGVYEVSYDYKENDTERQLAWWVTLEGRQVEARSDLSELAQIALTYGLPTIEGN